MRKALFAAAVAVVFAGRASCETYTMETYYPAPAGVYTNMTVTSTTVLARDGGAVTVGTTAKPAKLDVSGNANVTGNAKITGVVVPGNLPADPTDPAQKVEGAIYFNTVSKKHRVFQNGAWTDLGGNSFKVTSDPCNATNVGEVALGAVTRFVSGGHGHPSYPVTALKWTTCSKVFDPNEGEHVWLWK